METTCHLRIESVERFSGDINKVRDELDEAGRVKRCSSFARQRPRPTGLDEIFAGTQLAQRRSLHFPLGALHNGFRLVPDRMVVLSSSELFRRTDLRRIPRQAVGKGDR